MKFEKSIDCEWRRKVDPQAHLVDNLNEDEHIRDMEGEGQPDVGFADAN